MPSAQHIQVVNPRQVQLASGAVIVGPGIGGGSAGGGRLGRGGERRVAAAGATVGEGTGHSAEGSPGISPGRRGCVRSLSRSSFYYWRSTATMRKAAEVPLAGSDRAVHTAKGGIYGAPALQCPAPPVWLIHDHNHRWMTRPAGPMVEYRARLGVAHRRPRSGRRSLRGTKEATEAVTIDHLIGKRLGKGIWVRPPPPRRGHDGRSGAGGHRVSRH